MENIFAISIVYYKNKIYPTGQGWTLFYGLLVLAGLGCIIYQIVDSWN